MGVPASTLMPLILVAPADETARSARAWSEAIKRLARIDTIETAPSAPPGSLQIVVRGETAALPLGGIVDLTAERARLDKEIDKVRVEIGRVDSKLRNEDFLNRAPEDVVAEHEARREALEEQLLKLTHARERLDRV